MNINKTLLLLISVFVVSCSDLNSKNEDSMTIINNKQIEDVWYTFPAAMGEDQAWITYNHEFSKIAKTDTRNNHLRVRVKFKDPTEYGMPTNEEFPFLLEIDENLNEEIAESGGIYVGRITVGGYRYFYFYTDIAEKKAKKIVDKIGKSSNYRLELIWKPDREKEKYWKELFPTADDWQVIKDLKILDVLAENGDNKDIERTVDHWAYFPTSKEASQFKEWALGKGYTLISIGLTEDKQSHMVRYSHMGTMNLRDITHHTINSNIKARGLNGEYDGWETSVEK